MKMKLEVELGALKDYATLKNPQLNQVWASGSSSGWACISINQSIEQSINLCLHSICPI